MDTELKYTLNLQNQYSTGIVHTNYDCHRPLYIKRVILLDFIP